MRELKNKYLFLVIIVIFFFACSKQALTPEEYVKWHNENKDLFMSEKTIGGYTFKIQYQDLNCLVLNELNKSKETTKEKFEQLKKAKGNLQYFLFRVESEEKNIDVLKKGISDNLEYDKRVQYFSFEIKNDVILIEGQDTLKCVLNHFERNYGMAPFINILLAFEKSPNNATTDKFFIFNDNELGIGKIKLCIKKENLEKIPTLLIE